MKHKVADLEGTPLDAAVAKASGWRAIVPDGVARGAKFVEYVDAAGAWQAASDEWFPSTDWDQGGPIIERERIVLWPCAGSDDWMAAPGHEPPNYPSPTPLIAAMRAYVASKLGEEVEL